MGKLEKYSSYKDSGVKWLGEIPEHWKIDKLKNYCKAFGRIGFRGYNTSDLVNESEGAITISPSNISEYSMMFDKCSFLRWEKYYESPEIQIEENDILIVKTGSTFGKIGMVKNLPEKATINPQLLVLKDIKIEQRFFYYMMTSSIIQTQVNQQVIGSTIPTISESKILNFVSILPPKEEQAKIASFLDDKTAQIDEVISQKEKLIELLKERKQIIINDAVTKGLDKDVEFVDSGVEWLGEIPEHWEIKKLKYALKFTTGGTPSSGVENYYNGEEPWVTIADMTGRYIEKSHFISKKAVRECNMQIVPKNSLLYSFKLSVGQVAFTKEEIYTNEAIASFYPSKNIDLNFWYYVLPIFLIKNANTNIYGAFLLNQDLIKNALIIFPPKEEQIKIVEYIENQTTKIDKAIELQQNYISKLKEYKASLIDSVVTGKVRIV